MRQVITDLAAEIGLRHSPKLAVCPPDAHRDLKQPYALGSFHHWFIAVDYQVALDIQQNLQDPDNAPVAQARLVHELYHFKSGDYWQLGYAGELLRLTFLFMAWALVFLLGFGFLLLVVAPDFVQLDFSEVLDQVAFLTPEARQTILALMPSPADMQQVREKAAGLNWPLVLNFVAGAILPFIVIGGVLWGLYWPKLWRTRELYADAGVSKVQGKVTPFISALTKIPLSILQQYALVPVNPISFQAEKRNFWHRISGWIRCGGELFRKHPDPAKRIACINDPARVFDSWFVTASLVGSLTLLLDGLLSGTLTLIHIGRWPMHFSTLTVFIVVSLNLIHPLVLGRSVWPDIVRICLVVVGMRLAWVLLTLGGLIVLLIFAPGFLSNLLAEIVASVAHYAGFSDEIYVKDLPGFIMEASILNLAQVVIQFVVLLIALSLISLLVRRLLTWHSFAQADRWLMRIAYSIIAMATVFLALTVLPLMTTALLQSADLANPSGIAIGCLVSLISATGMGLFVYADHRFSRRCPDCGVSLSTPFALGQSCVGCGRVLHTWLMVEYQR